MLIASSDKTTRHLIGMQRTEARSRGINDGWMENYWCREYVPKKSTSRLPFLSPGLAWKKASY
ncbi:hypothetical protein PAHAL_3G007200 [Panicum hallii]|uniref:Uncharacterized protein n=1 Tax=Panicum hallii TaxID=206008 RepID=A0A2T8KGL6_9POAL|nr:hypothetical protein PAHAL_3G007200 [Panicum hallii]